MVAALGKIDSIHRAVLFSFCLVIVLEQDRTGDDSHRKVLAKGRSAWDTNSR